MTKVDERAFVPELDDDALSRLSTVLDREGVVTAMLIGSQARGGAGPLSDVDIAVWHEPGIEAKQRWDLQLSLIDAAQDALGTTEAYVVMLNQGPPLLQQRAIRDGMRLVERDRDQRVRFETRAVLDYLDTEPLRVARKENLKRQLRRDRFGRR
jgi:uncharacterized protein